MPSITAASRFTRRTWLVQVAPPRSWLITTTPVWLTVAS